MASTENGSGATPPMTVTTENRSEADSSATGEATAVAPGVWTNDLGNGATTEIRSPSEAARQIAMGSLPLPPHMAGADLPIANISRIMKRALPENGKIAKNAKECMQECVSELISFITSEASDRCGSEKRKTINGDDILYSLRVLGFDNYEQVLKVYLSRYRQAQEENPRQRRRRSVKRRMSGTEGEGDGSALAGEDDVHDEEAVSDNADDDE